MEEEKAAAYYEELTRKGEGAARFKRGLGFSSSSSADNASAGSPPRRGSSFISATSSSSFLSGFVKASGPDESKKLEKESQLHSIQNKLRKRTDNEGDSRDYDGRDRDRVRDRDGDRGSDRDRVRDRGRDRDRDDHSRRRRRSRSQDRNRDVYDRHRDGERERDRDGLRRREKERGRDPTSKGPDYSKLIRGYENMTPADRVKAKLKLQLAETAKKDEATGMGHGWERFDFDKDAPLDDEEEVEAAEDDAALVKRIGQSFRYSTIQARREEEMKAAHDEAMFGSPIPTTTTTTTTTTMTVMEKEPELENDNHGMEMGEGSTTENVAAASLLSEKVLARQQISWRDRARKA